MNGVNSANKVNSMIVIKRSYFTGDDFKGGHIIDRVLHVKQMIL